MKKQWKILSADEQAVQQLQAALGLPPALCRVLWQRGFRTERAVTQFFDPQLTDLHDPFLMADMDMAVQRLSRAVNRKEKILLYGDYDVDGTTSVAMLYDFLSKYTDNLEYYVPGRYKEGYGLSWIGIEYAHANNVHLIIAMDCGITGSSYIDAAHDLGIDFIVCDHHLPKDEVPDAVAVLDPKRADCNYPYKELSGCGVTFKLAQAYTMEYGLPLEDLFSVLDFVAVSIAADIVPITGENRILAHYGLRQLHAHPRIGLEALIAQSGRQKPLNISDIVFYIAPMINAMGRLGDAKEAVRLLLSKDAAEAKETAKFLAEQNRTRRAIDQKYRRRGN